MKFDIITIFPDIFDSYLNESILKRARKNKLIDIKIHNLRDFTTDKHNKVDDKPYGGGPRMVFKIEPLVKAIQFVKTISHKLKTKNLIILFSPAGKQFDNKMAAQLAKNYNNLILICGHYEGIDARLMSVLKTLKLSTLELSIGSYVLTGGELPAMVLIDAVSRQVPGVLGKGESLEEKRFGVGAPAYTRPEKFIYKNKNIKFQKFFYPAIIKKLKNGAALSAPNNY